MSETMGRTKRMLSKGIYYAFCEPKLRLGRRRHDDTCDHCGRECPEFGMERVRIPFDKYNPDGDSRVGALRALWNGEYVYFCMECNALDKAGKIPPDSRGEADEH